ncbi:F-box/LRR-repeat protein 3 [Citrus sinensis]|uniref:F-box/LRR-repeat protein 3 n=1 Tax=Citrus sinensis TaxID=2711 RepID=A0ACB8JFY9_CITSI|nr:F-box/LRR-repeat protein 3 [Citrus sinensis]
MEAKSKKNSNPFDFLSEEIIFNILDHLNNDPFARKSFSLTCRNFYSIESRHRKILKPLCAETLSRTSARYPFITQLDLSLCPRANDDALSIVSSSSWKLTLRSINLSRSRLFTKVGLSSLTVNCRFLTEIDLSNGTEMGDAAAAAIAEAKNLERLWLARCKLITDLGIGRIAACCRKLKLLCLKWCIRVTDLGVELVALKCQEIRTLDLSYLPVQCDLIMTLVSFLRMLKKWIVLSSFVFGIGVMHGSAVILDSGGKMIVDKLFLKILLFMITEKCLPPVVKLQYLEDLVLEGCHGIDDDGLASVEYSCKSLKALNLSKCQNISHVGLSSLIKGADYLQQLILAYSFWVSADLSKCLHNFPMLQSIKFEDCPVARSGIKAIGNWHGSLKELSLSKCSGVTDEELSFVVQSHKELRKLDITCCRKITYASINSITKTCTSLTSLRMECCKLVSWEAFVLIGQQCQYLEELDITENEVNDEGLKSISRCSKLSSLKLGICSNITDEGLKHVGSTCSMLKELDLYRSSGITDVGVVAVSHGCPSLEMINIAYNERITDTSLISLSECLRLKVLEIRGCPRISAIGLSAIAMGCRQLAMLDIKKCFNINDNGMIPLAQYSQNLKQINLSYCSVTDVGLIALASINCLQNMTILHVVGLTPNGLVNALLRCQGLIKVKLNASFRPLLPQSFLHYMEAQNCLFLWRDKAFPGAILFPLYMYSLCTQISLVIFNLSS